MGKSRKSSEKQLKGMILSRFFLVLVIVSVVEFIVIALTNTYLIPNLIMVQKYGSLIRIDGAEGLFIIVFVLIMTLIANKIFPTLKISPSDINKFLEDILQRYGFYGTDVKDATETIRVLSENPKVLLAFFGSLFGLFALFLCALFLFWCFFVDVFIIF